MYERIYTPNKPSYYINMVKIQFKPGLEKFQSHLRQKQMEVALNATSNAWKNKASYSVLLNSNHYTAIA